METGVNLLDQQALQEWDDYIDTLDAGVLKRLETCAREAFYDEVENISKHGVHDGAYRGLSSWYHYVGKSGLYIKGSYLGIDRPSRFSTVQNWLMALDRPWAKQAADLMHAVRAGEVKVTYNPNLIFSREKKKESRWDIIAYDNYIEWDFSHYLWGLMYHRLELWPMGNCMSPENDPWGDKDMCLNIIDITDTPQGSRTYEEMGLPGPVPGLGFSLKFASKGKYGTPACVTKPVIGPMGYIDPENDFKWGAWLRGETPIPEPEAPPAPSVSEKTGLELRHESDGDGSFLENSVAVNEDAADVLKQKKAMIEHAETKIVAGVERKIREDLPQIKAEVREELLSEDELGGVDVDKEIEKRYPPERERVKALYKSNLMAEISSPTPPGGEDNGN